MKVRMMTVQFIFWQNKLPLIDSSFYTNYVIWVLFIIETLQLIKYTNLPKPTQNNIHILWSWSPPQFRQVGLFVFQIIFQLDYLPLGFFLFFGPFLWLQIKSDILYNIIRCITVKQFHLFFTLIHFRKELHLLPGEKTVFIKVLYLYSTDHEEMLKKHMFHIEICNVQW